MADYILAIDPGNVVSGYALLSAGEQDIEKIVECGKLPNKDIQAVMNRWFDLTDMLAIEMIAHYGQGMAAGATTFDTCVWIGRFLETAERDMQMQEGVDIHRIMRREEKINLCGSMKAKDKDIKQALVDRYAPGQSNYGKGTKKDPGFFYGVSADMWQAIAVGVTAFDIYVRGITP